MKVRVTKRMRTETAHALYDYDGDCRHIHGHSYLWEVTVEGETDENTGMVMDFKKLKQVMQEHIGHYDHKLLLDILDPLARHNQDALVFDCKPTAEELVKEAFIAIYQDLKIGHPGVDLIKIRVWETEDSYAECRG